MSPPPSSKQSPKPTTPHLVRVLAWKCPKCGHSIKDHWNESGHDPKGDMHTSGPITVVDRSPPGPFVCQVRGFVTSGSIAACGCTVDNLE